MKLKTKMYNKYVPPKCKDIKQMEFTKVTTVEPIELGRSDNKYKILVPGVMAIYSNTRVGFFRRMMSRLLLGVEYKENVQ